MHPVEMGMVVWLSLAVTAFLWATVMLKWAYIRGWVDREALPRGAGDWAAEFFGYLIFWPIAVGHLVRDSIEYQRRHREELER